MCSKASCRSDRAGAAVFPLRTEVAFDTGEADRRRSVVGGTGTVFFGFKLRGGRVPV